MPADVVQQPRVVPAHGQHFGDHQEDTAADGQVGDVHVQDGDQGDQRTAVDAGG